MQRNGVRHRHTTHQLGPRKIAYRFHPFFDREVQVIRKLRAYEEAALLVQVDDDVRIAIPCWMLDQSVCEPMELSEKPRISIESLLQLNDLITQRTSLVKEDGTGRGSNVDEREATRPTTTKGPTPNTDAPSANSRI